MAYFERTRVAWDGDDTAVVARLLPVVADPAVRGRLLKLLSRAGDSAALAVATGVMIAAAVMTAAIRRSTREVFTGGTLRGGPEIMVSGKPHDDWD